VKKKKTTMNSEGHYVLSCKTSLAELIDNFISDIEDRKEMGLQRNKVDKDREYLTMVLSPTIMSILVRLYLTKKYHQN
jgi:hypothetical protein